MRIFRRALQTITETFRATLAFLRLVLQAFRYAPPLVVPILINDYLKPGFFRITDAFITADFKFRNWENIGIAIENHRSNPVIDKTFNYCRRARCTTGVKQQPTAWHINLQLVFDYLTHTANLTIIRDCRYCCEGVPLQHWIEIISHIVKVNPFDCCEKRSPVKENRFFL